MRESNERLVAETTARYDVPRDLFYADGMNAALLIIEALRATGGDTSAAVLIATMEGMASSERLPTSGFAKSTSQVGEKC